MRRSLLPETPRRTGVFPLVTVTLGEVPTRPRAAGTVVPCRRRRTVVRLRPGGHAAQKRLGARRQIVPVARLVSRSPAIRNPEPCGWSSMRIRATVADSSRPRLSHAMLRRLSIPMTFSYGDPAGSAPPPVPPVEVVQTTKTYPSEKLHRATGAMSASGPGAVRRPRARRPARCRSPRTSSAGRTARRTRRRSARRWTRRGRPASPPPR
jgi:hypothetical protein